MTFIKCARVELSWWCDSEYTVTYWEKVVLLLTGPWGLIGCCCMWPLFIYPPICFSLTGFPLIQGHIGKSVCVCICVWVCVSVCVYVWGMHEQICTLYLLLTIDLHNQAGCRNVPSPCLCFSCGVLWVSEVMGFIISAPQRKCEKATECQQILLELTWLASPQTGGQAFEIWLQLSMKQMNPKYVMSRSTISWRQRFFNTLIVCYTVWLRFWWYSISHCPMSTVKLALTSIKAWYTVSSSSVPMSSIVVQKALETYQWATPLHWGTCSFITMKTHF